MRSRLRPNGPKGFSFVLLLIIQLGVLYSPIDGWSQGRENRLMLAAASNLRFPMNEVIAEYKKQRSTQITVSYGASGSLAAQIIAGAPYDLFFSADEEMPIRLSEAKLVLADSYFIYGSGQIVLWVLNQSPIDLNEEGMKALLHPTVKKIAIANPRYAPYGMASIAALKSMGFYEDLKSKLVFGENIFHTAEFVRKGGAEIGILSYSLASAPPLEASGRHWPVPLNLYPKFNQAAVILRRSQNIREAQSFVKFIQEEDGRAIFAKYGLLDQRLAP